ncbi:MAG TPA: hypothetical protein VF397_11575 [Pyrinomonadaceae bacterium]
MDAVAVADIKSRRDFHESFQAAMSGAHDTLRALWHFERGQNLPKSYLVEFHPVDSHNDNSTAHSWGTTEVYTALKRATKKYGGEIGKTQDDGLFWLRNSEGPEHEADFVVDCLDPRFLVFHTLSNVEYTDRFIINRLTQYQPEFDLFWFPVSLLERTETRERINGWQAQFRPMLDVDLMIEPDESNEPTIDHAEDESIQYESTEFESSDEPPARLLHRPRLNIDLEYQYAFETYKKLREQPDLLPDMPLSAVLAERSDENATSYARARITSDGKITGRGPDFGSYLQIVSGTLNDYAQVIQRLESKYWIRVDMRHERKSVAISVIGEPFCIRFSHEVDVKRLVGFMFNCSRPFRLMGEVEAIEEDYFTVEAVDLHVNQPVGFEIASTFMRIYLYAGTCGNTLVRIIRSLQHSIDSKLEHPPLA